MSIRSFKKIPENLLEWGRFWQSTEIKPDPGSVTDGSFQDRTANSVLGRPSGTSGAPSDITLAAGKFLVNRSGTLKGDGIVDADLPSGIARDTEVAAAVSAGDAVVTAAFQAADAAHVAAVDPHPQYQTQAEADALYQPLAAVLSMLHTGSATPEGAVTGSPGHIYLRTGGGAGTSLYVKESGSATNTGWVAK